MVLKDNEEWKRVCKGQDEVIGEQNGKILDLTEQNHHLEEELKQTKKDAAKDADRALRDYRRQNEELKSISKWCLFLGFMSITAGSVALYLLLML